MNTCFRTIATVMAIAAAMWLPSCKSANPANSETATNLTDLELHEIKQELIRECMAEEGFTYQPETFYDVAAVRDPLSQNTLLANPEFGYGAAYSILSIALATELEGTMVSPESSAQFEAARLGETFFERQEVDPNATPEGCTGRARQQMEDTYGADPDDTTDVLDDFEEIRSRESYREFASRWRECMAAQGHEILANDPVEHAIAEVIRLRQKHPIEPGALQLTPVALVNDEVFISTINESEDVALSALYQDELQTARGDRDCRSSAAKVIEDDLAAIGK